jgi:serralysin
MAILTDLSPEQLDEVTYLSGLDEDGRIGKDTWFTWNYADFSKTQVWMNKFYNDSEGTPFAATSEAGTPGGTVTYSFGAGLPAQS